jgi:hypothetical protein
VTRSCHGLAPLHVTRRVHGPRSAPARTSPLHTCVRPGKARLAGEWPRHSCARRIRADRKISGPAADHHVWAWPPAPAAHARRAPLVRRSPCWHFPPHLARKCRLVPDTRQKVVKTSLHYILQNTHAECHVLMKEPISPQQKFIAFLIIVEPAPDDLTRPLMPNL